MGGERGERNDMMVWWLACFRICFAFSAATVPHKGYQLALRNMTKHSGPQG